MNSFEWIGNDAILYKGRICPITENDGWGVVNAMNRVDKEEKEKLDRLKAELRNELIAEIKEGRYGRY